MKSGSTAFVAVPAEGRSVAVLRRIGRSWLPARDAAVVRYYFRNLHPAHGLRQRLQTRALRAGARWWRVRDGGSPDAPRAGPDAALVETVDALAAQAGQLLGEPDLGSIRRYILTRSHDAEDRYVAVLFGRRASRPLAALKIAPQDSTSLDRERQVLLTLRSRLDRELLDTLPAPIALLVHSRARALLLTQVSGRPAYIELLGAWNPAAAAARHLRSAAIWLGRFHRSTGSSEVSLPAGDPERLIAAAHRKAWPASSTLPDWASRLLDLRRSSPALSTAVHGDFWPRNMLVDDAAAHLPSVVDWHDGRETGDPAADLFHFPLSYSLSYPWRGHRAATPTEAFRLAFIDDNTVSRAVRSYLSLYCRAVDLDPSLLEPLLLLYLLQRGLREQPGDRTHLITAGFTSELWLDLYRLLSCADRSVCSG